MLGLRSFFAVPANIAIASNTTLATIGLTSPIAKAQNQAFNAYIFFTLGAAGGFKTEVIVPAGGTVYNVSITIFDNITPAVDGVVQVAAASFGKALANAGNYIANVTGYILNGTTAGTIDIQVAQNSSNADTLTVLQGSWMDVVKF